MVHSNREYIE